MKSFFFTAFICSLGLLLPDSTMLLAVNLSVCQNSKIAQAFGDEHKVNSPCETPKFFCARHGFMGKTFLTFYFKTCSDTRIICVYDVMFFSLRFHVSEMVIRYMKMQI